MIFLEDLRFLVRFLERKEEIIKIWAMSGVLHRGVGTPCHSGGPRRSMAEWEAGQASSTPRHSGATLQRRAMPLRSSATSWRNYYS